MINGVETTNSKSHPRDVSCHPAQGLASCEKPQGKAPPTCRQTLDALEALLRRIIWLPNVTDYAVLVIWALYTHAYDKFLHAPRLALHSPVPGCGKTKLLAILKILVRAGHK